MHLAPTILVTVMSVVLGFSEATVRLPPREEYPSLEVLRIGGMLEGDDLIREHSINAGRIQPTQVAHVHTFTGDNVSVIHEILVKSNTNNGAESVSLIAGGPGHTFVTLRFAFTSADNELIYTVELYGKKVVLQTPYGKHHV